MIFVIGDVHSEITKLQNLIEYISQNDNLSELIFIGDYIDKGESAIKTLDYLCKLNKQKKCTFLLGNHEYCWLNVSASDAKMISYLIRIGATATVQSFMMKDILSTKDLLLKRYDSFFNNLVNYKIANNYFIIHSGLPQGYYNYKPEDIPVEKLLFNRYDFFLTEEYYFKKYKIVFGHTGFYKPFIDKYKIGIDTAACYLENQPLSAFCIEEEFFINSSDEISYLKDYKFDICPNIVRVKPWRLP